MNALDFSPLFRSTIGFDRLMRLADAATRSDGSVSYPPYNIEKTGDEAYRLTMAVAGFAADDLELRVQENALFVIGKAKTEDETTATTCIAASRAAPSSAVSSSPRPSRWSAPASITACCMSSWSARCRKR